MSRLCWRAATCGRSRRARADLGGDLDHHALDPARQPGVAVNPDFDYVVVQCDGNERLVLAEALLKQAMGRYGIEDYHVLATAWVRDLEGLQLQHPFYDREVPMILGDHVTTEAGTGAVHTAPGHGQDDYAVGSALRSAGGQSGGRRWRVSCPDTELFAGKHVFKANNHVIEVLKANGALVHEEAMRHSYPHCWRHKTPIIFRATPQWFISMEQEGSARAARWPRFAGVSWMPEWGQARIAGMVEDRPDWCISRQRTWGVPIALFVHKETRRTASAYRGIDRAVATRRTQRASMPGSNWMRPNCSAMRRPITTRSTTRWTCGSTPASPTAACWSGARS